MQVLIIGAAGMIGRKLTATLLARPDMLGREITRITLADVVEPPCPATSLRMTTCACDLGDGAADLVAQRPDVIFHLAAIVSGEAEADFAKGYRINMDGTRVLLEAIRAEAAQAPYCPRLIFSSSIAVFGAPFPEVIGDEFLSAPLTSYGTQKAICELLINDCSRRGIVDGVSIRLPTVVIRPGKPNAAASGFFSNILREPLVGQEAVLPVSREVRHWFCSPRAAVGYLAHAAAMETAVLGTRRALSVPGLSATVGEEIEALRRIAGDKAVRLIREVPDATIDRIVSGWPQAFDARRAAALGFVGDASFDAIIRAHIDDELCGIIAP